MLFEDYASRFDRYQPGGQEQQVERGSRIGHGRTSRAYIQGRRSIPERLLGRLAIIGGF
jgi:hypothetical protein